MFNTLTKDKTFIFRSIILVLVFICLILTIIFTNFNFIKKEKHSVSSVTTEEFNSEPVNNVYFGRDGWLFYGESLADYQRINLFNDKELEKIKNNLETVKSFLDSKGISFYLLIAPNKNTIYPEYMPDNINCIDSISRLEQLCGYIKENTDIEIIEMHDKLISQKNSGQLYYKTDTHWNQEGARIASEDLLSAIHSDNPEIPVQNLDKFNKVHRQNSNMKDLAYILEKPEEYNEEEYIYTPKKNFIEILKTNDPSNSFGEGVYHEMNDRGEIYQLSHYIKLRNPELKNGKRLYMIRDSFAVNMIPFINESFYQSTYVWTSKFEKKAVLDEEPDVVVYEVVERYMQNLLWMTD